MIGVNTQASYQRLKSEHCNAVNEIVKVDIRNSARDK